MSKRTVTCANTDEARKLVLACKGAPGVYSTSTNAILDIPSLQPVRVEVRGLMQSLVDDAIRKSGAKLV